jgi:1-acyl-sn-glycerol-3-phosphate acyltransferase
VVTPVAGRVEHDTVERRVLELVEGLMAELGGPALGRPVRPQDSLDRDLGIGSLERVELLLRLEQEFGVRLADPVMADAESPRDLVQAIRDAAPGAVERPPETQIPIGPGASAPGDARTLVEVLRWHADTHPERVHIFLRQEGGSETPISYGMLWDRSAAVAAGLRERGFGSGQAVALMLRTESAFFDVFFGILLAGGVPVPIYPAFRLDRIEEYAMRQAGILRSAEARVLITFDEATRVAELLRRSVPSLEAVTTAERIAVSGRPVWPARHVSADPALIQYTSGSTGAPKGVLLSNANVLANIRAIGEAVAINPEDVAVSWLPLYHDMGLIGSWLACLHFGIPIVILSPLTFLSRPARWLQAIHAHRATLSPAPNFAFDLCGRKVTDAEIEGLDLSSWRLALNGSEPVSPETMERFTRRFVPYGFRPEAMCPVYGLAESSVALTVPPLGRGPWVDRVARAAFERLREAGPAAPDDENPLRFASCGRPLPGHTVRIVDAAGHLLGERVEGRIEFSGPSITSGYFQNPEATRAVLRSGWMDSGDLGYWASGELFITGRQKDIIIKAGRNLYPHEVEEVVGDIPGIRRGCVAAFGMADPEAGTERLIVIAESRATVPATIERLRSVVVDRVVSAIGLPPDAVVIARPGAVLKTSSGKIRRSATRDAYLRGEVLRGRASATAQWTKLLLKETVAWVGRFFSRADALVYAAYVGALVAVTVPPLWALLLVMPRGRAARRLVRFWCRAILDFSCCPVRVEGLERLRAAVPAVLASNHASYLDAVVLLAALPTDFTFVAKRELASAPFIGRVLRKIGSMTVERADPVRSVADAERATAVLRGGSSLLFFPEGTFVRTPGLLPFRLGAFKAAVEAGRPVIPIGLHGTRDILPDGTWLPRPGAITLAIGPPVTPEASGWQEMVRLRDLTQSELARLTGEPIVHGRPLTWADSKRNRLTTRLR